MNHLDLEKQVISETDVLIRRLAKQWKQIKKSKMDWDFQTLTKTLVSFENDLQQLSQSWDDKLQCLNEWVVSQQSWINSPAYTEAIEEALKTAKIPFQGSFPEYDFPPFKLVFKDDVVRLWLGKMQEKTTCLSPLAIAEWVSKNYKRVIEKKFDIERFLKELLAAYQKGNQINYREEHVMWGKAVPLELIYELLTLKQSAKKEYPKSLFVFEIARLKEQFEVQHEGYVFELGYARKQEKAFLIIDSKGHDHRLSSLTIYSPQSMPS